MKGLKVKLTIAQRKTELPDYGTGEESKDAEGLKDDVTEKLNELDLKDTGLAGDDDDDTQMYHMEVESGGKFTRKATWEDLKRFTGKEIDSDVFRDWIVQYQEKCFPEGMYHVYVSGDAYVVYVCVCVCVCVNK